MPVTSIEFSSVMEKARKAQVKPETISEIIKPHLKKNDNGFSKIFVRANNSYDIIGLDKIIYIQAVDSYSRIVLTGNQTYLESKPLNYFEDLLSGKGFWRLHKSYMINIKHLNKVVKESSSYVVMTENICLPVSSRRKMEFFEKLKKLNVELF